jgi:7-cyano-7-deazaguanine synthase in queuosine biosynthesis
MRISGPLDHAPNFDVVFSPAGVVRFKGEEAAQTMNSVKLGDHVIAGAFQATLPETVTDLVDVAIAAYIADRLCKRGANRRGRYLYGWARNIHVTVPLKEPEFWASNEISSRLRHVLGYLTEDTWTFEFVPRPSGVRSAYQQSLFPPDLRSPVRVALFSGGLDSLAGLCSEISEKKAESFVLFAGCTNNFHKGKQRQLAAAVGQKHAATILPCVVPFGFRGRVRRAGNHDESTQRSRGFVHSALGAATAVMAGVDTLAIYENGIGCINLPYTGAQIGAHLTKAANPIAIALMNDFLTAVLGKVFRVELPFIGQTKGEMCRSLSKLGIQHLTQETTSCDRFLRQAQNQCGVCTSCVLRRLSLHAAGLSDYDPRGLYAYDVYSSDAQILERDVFGYRMMVDQACRLNKALGLSQPWPALVTEFPDLFEVSLALQQTGYSGESAANLLVRLYQQYSAEWNAFPARPPRHRLYTSEEHGADHGEYTHR